MDNMLALRTGTGIKFICFHEILYCKADGRYTHVFLNNGDSVITARLLKSFENKLPATMFVRIHKSYVINMNYISSLSKKSSVFLVVGTDIRLGISKRRRKRVFEALGSNFIYV
jgi:two-component system LytT family response regulator